MIANLLTVGDEPAETLDLEPGCVDFCDTCGDCLHCYSEDPCGAVDGKEHAWVVYPEDVSAFRERFGIRAVLGEDQP